MSDTSTYAADPATIAQTPHDPLGEILHLLKLTGTFYCQSRLTAPWAIAVPAFPDVLTFAVVTGGRCWLTLEGRAPLLIEQGNLVLLTNAAEHAFRSAPEVPPVALEDLPITQVTELYETLDYGGGGESCSLMYGIVRVDHAAAGMLMQLLPDVLKVDTWSAESGTWLQGTLQFIAQEARAPRPGGETVITRLADVVLIEAIRRWINSSPDANKGWLKGARDPQIGRAIMAIHKDPAGGWTVESLASEAGMSRSAFSAKFSQIVGMSVMQYLTHWRMQLARTRLLNSAEPILGIAFDLGYQSEAAFNRAFKRVFDIPPGQVRKQARAG